MPQSFHVPTEVEAGHDSEVDAGWLLRTPLTSKQGTIRGKAGNVTDLRGGVGPAFAKTINIALSYAIGWCHQPTWVPVFGLHAYGKR